MDRALVGVELVAREEPAVADPSHALRAAGGRVATHLGSRRRRPGESASLAPLRGVPSRGARDRQWSRPTRAH
jgi:hypothetical protein